MDCVLLPQASTCMLPCTGQCGKLTTKVMLTAYRKSVNHTRESTNAFIPPPRSSALIIEKKGCSAQALLEAGKCFDLQHEGTSEDEGGEDSIEKESLTLLEWLSVCEQVSRFASTPIARQRCREGSLPFGQNQEESETLLEQTASAFLIPSPLDFSGIVDVSDMLRSASSGTVLTVSQLCVVEKMLSSTKRVYEQLHNCIPVLSTASTLVNAALGGPSGKDSSSFNTRSTLIEEFNLYEGHHPFFPLLSIMADVNFCTSLVQVLHVSLDRASLSILDTASPVLSAVRASRRENMKALETLLLEIGDKVVSVGGMDSVIITTRRARQCVAVRASHKHLLPGGVVLDLSNSGATVFMEPKAALALNNKEVELASRERAEEYLILETLTQKLADVAGDIWVLLEKVTCLDLACARAGHAHWLHSVRPTFNLKRVLTKEGKQRDEGFSETLNAFSVYIEGLFHPLLLGQTLKEGINFPVPVDFKVKSGVSVIVISGPNTGGKTASMKTFGLAVLMAKAGLFLPAKGKALLPWFDKVLADIGDSQSLEQSLSTFSGHIRRVCRILEAGSCQSLVLFDEIGSGTDPSEGAALATAILEHMADNVYLTVATTHFSKLRSFREGRFEVASVEFDIETLRPKYKVLWGVAGQSNALDIASSLGVDESILVRARHWMRKLAPEIAEQRTTQLMDPLIEQRKVLESQAQDAALVLLDAKQLHNELAAEADGMETRICALRLQREDSVKRDISAAKSCMEEIVSIFESGNFMPMGEALGAIASVVDTYMKTFGESEKANVHLEATGRPSVGDCVLIKRLGKTPATVIEAPTEKDESFLVQLGGLKVRAKLSEVTKILQIEKSQAGQQRMRRIAEPPSESWEVRSGAAVQTSRNTLDLRGMRVDDALMHLHSALLRSRRASVVFVVHGEGTGALRAAVLEKLKGHPLVSKFEQESPMNYGCTAVYLK